MDKQKILSLGKLARIGIGDEEAENLSHEFGAILNYVGEIKKLKIENSKIENYPTRNSMREDGKPHEGGLYTEKLLSLAPARENNYFKVKKIL